MLNSLKAPFVAILLSSVAVVPAATISVLVTADLAYAKSDKSNGKGGSQRGGKSQGKSGSKSASSSRSGDRGNKSGSGGLSNLFEKLTGKDKKASRSSGGTSVAKAKDNPMHPSNLGNMNGALNANMNAVLAHIRNGNTNGPVGHLAALAVASSNAAGAQDIVDAEALFTNRDEALAAAGFLSVEDYYNEIQKVKDIEEAIANLGDAESSPELEGALANAGYDSDTALQDYLDDKDAGLTASDNEAINEAIIALGGDPTVTNEGDNTTAERADPEVVLAAQDSIGALSDAELAILSYWNKNDGVVDPDDTGDKELLQALHDRLVGYEDEITAAIPKEEEIAVEGCEEGDEGCVLDEPVEEVAAVE
jgi:hypothetical protein